MKKTLLILLTLLVLLAAAHVDAEGEYRITIEDNDLSITQGLNKKWINILLIGSDSRIDEDNQGRGDALIICSVNKSNGQVKLTSLARDMYVTLGGQRFKDRINTGLRYGGPNLMMKTVNETFGMNISDYVSINFYGLCDMVDAVGGIDLTLSRAERDEINEKVVWNFGNVKGEPLPAGKGDMTLRVCGAQALAYARIRSLDSDINRNRRQRNVLMGIVSEVKELSVGEILSLAKVCFEYVDTDMSFLSLMSLGTRVLMGNLGDIKQLSLPAEGKYRFANYDGKAVTEFDHEDAKERLHSFIYGDQK